ncbi:hypothetical protein NPIL_140651 [Nephila pilipes]|uniref:Uncharacterized protein n=1 Tax=Nephila pilipes TaxID=299642 RepID=A0A8X6TAA2_NEPPI|nr:hypothetical protein NPIL_140651 [Nephila pilipes]
MASGGVFPASANPSPAVMRSSGMEVIARLPHPTARNSGLGPGTECATLAAHFLGGNLHNPQIFTCRCKPNDSTSSKRDFIESKQKKDEMKGKEEKLSWIDERRRDKHKVMR